MNEVVVGLGASLGERRAALEVAAAALACWPGATLLGASRLYGSRPVGGVARNGFLNAAVRLAWRAPLAELLDACLAVEQRMGRCRGVRWADRPLDLDLLWVRGPAVDVPGLQVPHPRLAQRPFALVPLLDLVPDAADPVTGAPYATLPAARGVGLWPVGVLVVPPGAAHAAGGYPGGLRPGPRGERAPRAGDNA